MKSMFNFLTFKIYVKNSFCLKHLIVISSVEFTENEINGLLKNNFFFDKFSAAIIQIISCLVGIKIITVSPELCLDSYYEKESGKEET